jgi:hypothetical protein
MTSRASASASKGATGHTILASVIVPAYKEGANLRELITRVFAAFDGAPAGALQRSNVEIIVGAFLSVSVETSSVFV